MDSQVEIFIKRANNEILGAKSLKRLSEEVKYKDEFSIPKDITFYSSVISHSYYAIFYSAKAYLVSKNIPLKSSQGQHQQVYYEFRKLVEKGIIEKELLNIYEEIMGRAEALLDILKTERTKRTNFTYETIPQANKEPAENSLNNAIFFLSHIIKFIGE